MRTSDGLSCGTQPLSLWKFSSRPHSDEAGDHATGLSLPLAIFVAASPEATTVASTNTGLPPDWWSPALNCRTSGAISASFSGE